jgi:hypothetical protein
MWFLFDGNEPFGSHDDLLEVLSYTEKNPAKNKWRIIHRRFIDIDSCEN